MTQSPYMETDLYDDDRNSMLHSFNVFSYIALFEYSLRSSGAEENFLSSFRDNSIHNDIFLEQCLSKICEQFPERYIRAKTRTQLIQHEIDTFTSKLHTIGNSTGIGFSQIEWRSNGCNKQIHHYYSNIRYLLEQFLIDLRYMQSNI